MASPITSTFLSGMVSRLAGAGAREKSWRGACGCCCWNGAKKSPPNHPPPPPPPLRGGGGAERCGGAAEAGEVEELRRGGSRDRHQNRKRRPQRDQRAGLGQHLEQGLLRHAISARAIGVGTGSI